MVDSCADVPKEQVNKHGMYVIPLSIIYKDRTYLDGVDIEPEEIYDNFDTEIPSTSLPTGEIILDTLKRIKEDGYEKVLAVTISSGLSGTYNLVRLLGDKFKGLDFFAVDSKSIGMGCGVTAIMAAENLAKGMSWSELKEATIKSVEKVKIFFCVATLKYLRAGGRIGLVSSIIGENLNIKPIISCNEDGIYYTAALARGRKKSLRKALELAEKFIAESSAKAYNLVIAHGNAKEDIESFREQASETLQGCKQVFDGQVGPAIVVHTGPGLIAVAVQCL